MLKRFFGCIAALLFLTASPDVRAEDPLYGVRLLSHFHKKVTDEGLGVGGWLIVPNMVTAPQTPLFIVGPRYQGKGWWAEVMLGGVVRAADDMPLVNSNRFQFTPKAIGAPVNVWGNLQFIDVTGDTIPYLFLMVDYVLPNRVALIGVETENYFNLPPGADETFNDTSFGPQLILPFQGLNMIMAYQIHTHENIPNQVWFRAMYDFKGFGKK